MNKRITFIDAARAVGIMLVVLGHVIGLGEMTFAGSDVVFKYIYSFHMALFFVISGLVLGHSFLGKTITQSDIKHRIRSRIQRLLIPYFVWSFIYFLLDVSTLKDLSVVKEWIYCIFTFRGRAPVWFLGALFWAEICVILIISIFKQNKIRISIFTLVIAVAAVFLWKLYGIFPKLPMPVDYLVSSICRETICVFFVLSGYLFSQRIVREESIGASLLWAVGVGCVNFLVFWLFCDGNNLHTYHILNLYSFLINGLLGSLTALLLCKALCKVIKAHLLQRIGGASLGIMCIHYTHLPFIQYGADICSILHLSGLAACAVSFCFVFIVSFILTEILKKTVLV